MCWSVEGTLLIVPCAKSDKGNFATCIFSRNDLKTPFLVLPGPS